MSSKNETPLLGICGVYCGACTTYRAYNDNDQALVKWEVKMGMPCDEIYCKGCTSNLVNEWCSNCDFRKCVEERGIEYCFDVRPFPARNLLISARQDLIEHLVSGTLDCSRKQVLESG